jgi:hypothetical protein
MLKNRQRGTDTALMEFRGKRPRHARRAVIVVLLMAASMVPAIPGGAQTTGFDPTKMVFPVVGRVYFSDTFGAPRSGGRVHEGIDIMSYGIKGLPVVAAADGTVRWIGSTCCYLAIDHGGGYETWYIHLNNDTPGTDDGQGWGIAPGLVPGVKVRRGQLIGWVGDSGNAESTAPHLHFELRLNGTALNTYQLLLQMPRLSAAAPNYYRGPFWDDDGSGHEAHIEALYARNVTAGCEVIRFCHDDQITRGQLATFIHHIVRPAAATTDYFTDDTGGYYEPHINALAAAGIVFGCTASTFCPDRPIPRGEAAEFLARAFQLPPAGTNTFYDDDASPYEGAINSFWETGVTAGCDPTDQGRFCPDRTLTRAEMATFLIKLMDRDSSQ